jgi:PAS domain S-box-containing protein
LQHGCEGRFVEEVVLAIEEAMTNAVRHSGTEKPMDVVVGFENAHLVVDVKDRGRGFAVEAFDPDHIPDVLSSSGRGLFLIGQLMDELTLQGNDGLQVHMVKRLPAEGTLQHPRATIMPLPMPGTAQREERLRLLVEEIDEAFAALDWQYRFVYANRETTRLLGTPREELLGRTPQEVWPNIVGSDLERGMRDAMEIGKPSRVQYWSVRRERWLEARIYPAATGISVYGTDITERKRAAEALRENLLRTTALREIASISATSAGEVDLAQRQVEAITRLLGTRAAVLWQLDNDGRLLVPSGCAGVTSAQVSDMYGPVSVDDENPTSHIFRSRKPTFLENLDSLVEVPEKLQSLRRTLEYRSAAVLPLLMRGEAVGCLSLLWGEPRVFTPDEVTFLESLATDVAVGLNNNRLLGKLGQSNEELTSNIEALRSAIELLEGSQERVRAILDSLLDPHVKLDAVRDERGQIVDFVFADANLAACEFNGLAYDQLVGTRLLGLHPAAGTTELFGLYVRIVETGQPLVLDDWSYPQDMLGGEVRRYDVRAARAGDGVTQTWRDVTGRTRAERMVRASEARLHALVAASSQAIYIMSPAWRTMHQLSGGGFLPDTAEPDDSWLERYIPSEDQAEVTAVIDEAIRTRSVFELEHHVLRADGSVGWTSSRAVPVFDSRGRITEWFGAASDITERRQAEEELREVARLNETLVVIGKLAYSSLRPAEIVQSALAEGARAIGADAGAVSLHDEAAGGFWVRYGHNMPDDRIGVFVPDAHHPLGSLAMTSGDAVAVDDTSKDGRVVQRLATEWQVRAVVSAPLTLAGRRSGVIHFHHRTTAHHFSSEEVNFVSNLATILSIALENAQLYAEQQRIATILQENLIHALPEVEGLEIAALSLPANRPELIGGDFADVFVTDAGEVVVTIGDVAGKGVQAAGMTETVRSAVRAFATIDSSPASILRNANALLLRDGEERPHVTALVCVIDPRTGHAALASAGHPAPVYLSPSTCQIVEPPFGPPLGAFPADYEAIHLTLTPEGFLAFYTDGVTEARRDGEMLGEKRLVQALSGLRGRPASEVAAAMVAAARDFAGRLRDDVQVAVVRLT